MFYLKLASTNLKKNHRGYLPFLISMLFLVAINTMTQVIVNSEMSLFFSCYLRVLDLFPCCFLEFSSCCC